MALLQNSASFLGLHFFLALASILIMDKQMLLTVRAADHSTEI
jgi:hypothetical protein